MPSPGLSAVVNPGVGVGAGGERRQSSFLILLTDSDTILFYFS